MDHIHVCTMKSYMAIIAWSILFLILVEDRGSNA